MSVLKTVQKGDIDEVWPDVVDLLRQAIAYSDDGVTEEDLHLDLMNGDRQLWLVETDDKIDCVFTTQVIQHKRSKIGQCTFVAGTEPKRWLIYIPAVAAWFKEIGCAQIEMVGRKGWEKLLAPFGITHSHSSFRSKL